MGLIQNAVFSCFRTKRVHQRMPITFQGEAYAANTPRTAHTACPLGPWGDPPGAWEPLDSATSRATVNELKRTVLGWRSSYKPSHMIQIGWLPTSMSQAALKLPEPTRPCS